MARTNFYFGRIHFDHQLTSLRDFNKDLTRSQRIRNTLWNYVDTNDVVYTEQDGDIQWVFGVCAQEEGYILGKFGKVYPDKPTTYDFEKGEFIEEAESSAQADYSMFLIVPEKSLVIFNQRQHIGYRQFQEAFAGGYDNYLGLEDGLSIGLLQDTADIRNLIETANITHAEFELIPASEIGDAKMEYLDEHIRNAGAKNFQFSLSSQKGVNMDDPLIQSAIAMSAAGFGKFAADYERDGRKDHYESDEKPASHEVDRPARLTDLLAIADDLVSRANSLLTNYTN